MASTSARHPQAPEANSCITCPKPTFLQKARVECCRALRMRERGIGMALAPLAPHLRPPEARLPAAALLAHVGPVDLPRALGSEPRRAVRPNEALCAAGACHRPTHPSTHTHNSGGVWRVASVWRFAPSLRCQFAFCLLSGRRSAGQPLRCHSTASVHLAVGGGKGWAVTDGPRRSAVVIGSTPDSAIPRAVRSTRCVSFPEPRGRTTELPRRDHHHHTCPCPHTCTA